MEVITIEKQIFEMLKDRFDSFSNRIKELCKDNHDEVWMDNQEVCELLSISKRSLQNYRDNGTIPYSQIGYKCYYKKSDIEKLINESRHKNEVRLWKS